MVKLEVGPISKSRCSIVRILVIGGDVVVINGEGR
jgi:hypothetical protein